VKDTVSATLIVNSEPAKVATPPAETLAITLRERLGVRSVKIGCDDGSCGSCTVLLDGMPVNACLLLTQSAAGRQVMTIEGAGTQPQLNDLQEAFVELGAAQCGFCIPGMLLSSHVLLAEGKPLDRDAVREALAGHLCRCTGYEKQLDAILAVSGSRK
jgi:carbon-monoxide dehydrogenase small subunit